MSSATRDLPIRPGPAPTRRRGHPDGTSLLAPRPPGPRPTQRLPDPSDWSFELIEQYHDVIRATAQRFGLDTYPNQLEIITAEQMMDAYASVGMPVNYRHWSYGKEFIATEKNYKRGHMGLAYEIVINSDPCISYLMEENTTAMQALVIAHAAYGHNSFFKGNYLFKLWTDASSIIDYLVYSKNYIAECEERFGLGPVEELLDSCHALQNYGVDRYRRPSRLSLAEESVRRKERLEYAQLQVNDIWRTLPKKPERNEDVSDVKRFPAELQENILYFIEKNAPLLEPWQREIVRIVRKIAQYFYPQRQTQVMNEGWATFWHHRLLNTMYDDGYLTDGLMIEWLKSHTNVIYQPPVGHRAYNGINPYGLRDVHGHQARVRRAHGGGPRVVPGDRRQALAAHAGPRDAQLQGRELRGPVPVAQADARPAAVRHRRRRAGHAPERLRHPRPFGIPPGARGAGAPVRPELARAGHSGLEREPARRPLADLAPHPAQQPPAARGRPGGAQARRPAVGLRRAARQRRRHRHRDPAAGGAGAGELTRGPHQTKILPGFMMFFGSSACLRVRIIETAPSPASRTRKSILCSPMPCSPLHVPCASIAWCTSS
jgi:spore cortex formation protein SpoVR/YcgB (stage V sporulation)